MFLYIANKGKSLLSRLSGSHFCSKKFFNIGAIILMCLLWGQLCLILAIGNFSSQILFDYFSSFSIMALNTIPLIVLFSFLFGIVGNAYLSFFLCGIISLVLALANFYKLHFRNEPLYFEDLFLIREAANMAFNEYNLFLTWTMILIIFALFFLTYIIYKISPIKSLLLRKRIVIIAASCITSIALVPIYINPEIYESIQHYKHLGRGKADQEYVARGFVYPFLHSSNNIIEAYLSKFDSQKAINILNSYSEKRISDEKRINIIAIMREAYVDFSRYKIPGLDDTLYKTYHSLEKESYTGNLVTNVFSGDTIDTERCFLTGNYKLRNFRSNTNSYMWYLQRQGYIVEGSHPHYNWFYDRNKVNGFLGFENYRFYENDFQDLAPSGYVKDAILMEEIYKDFLASKHTGKPYFSFSVTMESHGPYPLDMESNKEYLDEIYSPECRSAMNYYLSITEDMDKELLELIERLRTDPEPIVLITFGDHLPWMGNGGAFYEEMGINIDTSTEEGFYNYYTTRYLIWANDAAKAVLGHDIQGEGKAISPCYLMNVLFEQLDWDGPAFLQAMDDIMGVFPVVNINGHYVLDGVLTTEIPEERKEMFQQFLYLQNYWRNNFIF